MMALATSLPHLIDRLTKPRGRLTAEARGALEIFGARGDRLRQLADHLLQRDF